MQIFNDGLSFGFNYATFDQRSGLFIAAKIYDVSNGASPSLVATVGMPELGSGTGYYSATFAGAAAKTYLVVTASFTDGTYTTLDTSRSPGAECYKSSTAPTTYGAFNYGVYSQNSSLFIAALLYDVSGIPALIGQIQMAHVFAGVYFGYFTGSVSHTYQVIKNVYTDGTYTTVSPNYSTGSDAIQLTTQEVLNVTNIFQGSPSLVGSQFNGQLQGQKLQATLVESIA